MFVHVNRYWTFLISAFGNLKARLHQHYNWVAAGVFIIALAFFYRDVVFQGRTFLIETADAGTMPTPSDGPYNYEGVKPGFVALDTGAIAWQIEPFSRFISTSIKKGDFPLWNPYSGLAGMPLFADGQTAPLEPIQFLFFFVPKRTWPYAVDFQLLIRFFIAGFSCYLFARRLKIDFLGSVVAGILFMFSGYFVSFGNHPQVKTEVLLPFVLYGYDRVADSEDKLGIWICALLIGWAIIAGMPESTFFSLMLGTLWFFYKTIVLRSGFEKSSLFRYMMATGAGFLLSAIYLLPFLEFVYLSSHVHDAAASGTESKWLLYGVPGLIFGTVKTYFIRIGFIAFFALIFSVIELPKWTERRKEILFFGGYAFLFLLAMFDFAPTNWIWHLPILRQIGMIKYPFPSINFCFAVLAAFVVDRVRKYPLSSQTILLAFSLVFIFLVFLPMFIAPEGANFFGGTLDKNNTFKLLFGLTAAVIFSNVFLGTQTKLLQIALVLIFTFEIFMVSYLFDRPSRVYPYQSPPFVDYLRNYDTNSFRIFAMDHILYPNISTAYELQDIRWLSGLIPKRAFDFTEKFIESDEVQTMRFTGSTFPRSVIMMDLLNVKYILTAKNSYSFEGLSAQCGQDGNYLPRIENNRAIELILSQNAENQDLVGRRFLVNDTLVNVIYAHPPQTFTLKTNLPASPVSLDFSIGLDPAVFSPDKGDGVGYSITITDKDQETQIFSKYIDPKQVPCDRRWFDQSVRLDNWAGKDVTIKFSTDGGPAGNFSWDWAHWGNIQLTVDGGSDAVVAPLPQFQKAYKDKYVQIYKNTNALPRAFVIYDIVNVKDFNAALIEMDIPKFDPARTAVVENFPAHLTEKVNQSNLPTQPGITTLISSGELNVRVDSRSPGLLVVSDQYYPGWKATVDGEHATIYAVDGIFRGVFLEEGDHIIQFKYSPLSFIIGGIISSFSLLITIMFISSTSKVLPSKSE